MECVGTAGYARDLACMVRLPLIEEPEFVSFAHPGLLLCPPVTRDEIGP